MPEAANDTETVWVRCHGVCVTEEDKTLLIEKKHLTDQNINFGQRLLSKQFQILRA